VIPPRREVRLGRVDHTVPFETPSGLRRTVSVGVPAEAPRLDVPPAATRSDRGDAPIVFRPADHLVPGEPLYGTVRQDDALAEHGHGWWSRLWGKLRGRPS